MKGLFYVLEQLPNKIIKKDQTQILKEKQGYWKSYNRANYTEIFELSGAQEIIEKYGNEDWFTYDKNPRSVIIDRDHKNITDMDTFMTFMRYFTVDFIASYNINLKNLKVEITLQRGLSFMK